MESVLMWLTEHAEHAPLMIFWLLVLAGFSLPFSEDVLVIASGFLASCVIPERTPALFMAALFGSLIADIIAFIIGRFFGSRIYNMKWFRSKQQGVDKLNAFYKKHGRWALFVGRCIPFGFRNGIFMSLGAAKMATTTFILCDSIACLAFCGLLFFLAYCFGAHVDVLYTYVHQTGLIIGGVVICALIIYAVVSRRKRAIKAS